MKVWVKKRHVVTTAILRPIFLCLDKLLYGFTPEKFKFEKGKPYLVLSNHQCTFDQFMVLSSFPRLLYVVASEDIFSHGFASSIISYLVAPIPKMKSQRDSSTIRNCMRIVKEGGSICIFPEGNRTYSGCTEHFDPVIARFAQSLGATLILYNLEGGYGVDPRWGNKRRKGKSRGFVKRVISPEELKSMPSEELYEIMKKELYVDDTSRGDVFTGDNKAEYLERALYWCPDCKQIGHLRSDNNDFYCDNCGLQVEYKENLSFEVKKGNCPYENVKQWYDGQKDFIRSIKLEDISKTKPLFSDENVKVLNSGRGKRRELLAEGKLCIYLDRLVLTHDGKELAFSFEKLSNMEPLNRNELNISFMGDVFKLKGEERFNCLKYLNLFYHIKNVSGGKEDEFLGL